MFEIEDSDDYGSPPMDRSKGNSKFGSDSQFHKPDGKSQKNSNSLFGGASVYDDDDAYNFTAPVDKKYHPKSSLGGKHPDQQVIPAFSPREEPLQQTNKTEISALDKAQQMLQKYSKGPVVRTGSFTSAPPVSNKFKTGRADFSYEEDDEEMSSEGEEEEEESGGPESYGDLSISSPGLAKKKMLMQGGMQRAPSSSILPTASTILENNKPKAAVSISNQGVKNTNAARKGLLLTNPEQSLEESIPEEDEDEEEISEEEEEGEEDGDDDDDDDYGDDEFDETVEEDEGNNKNNKPNKPITNIPALSNNHEDSGSENENASYSRMIYGDHDEDDDDDEEEVEVTMEESKPKILSFADLVNNAGWDPAAYEATKPSMHDSLLEESTSPEKLTPVPEESAEEYSFEPMPFEQPPVVVPPVKAAAPIIASQPKMKEVAPEVTTALPSRVVAAESIKPVVSKPVAPATIRTISQPIAAPPPAEPLAPATTLPMSNATAQVQVIQQSAFEQQPTTQAPPPHQQQAFPYPAQSIHQSYQQQYQPNPGAGYYPPQQQQQPLTYPQQQQQAPNPMSTSYPPPPPPHHYYGYPPPPYPYHPSYGYQSAEGLYPPGVPPPSMYHHPYQQAWSPYGHPYPGGPPPLQPPSAGVRGTDASQIVIMDLLREFNKVKEEADWAKRKLAETVIMLQQQQSTQSQSSSSHIRSSNAAQMHSPPRVSKDSPVIVQKPHDHDDVDESAADYSEDFEISQIHLQQSALKAKTLLQVDEDFEMIDEKSPPKISAEPAWEMPQQDAQQSTHRPPIDRYAQFSVDSALYPPRGSGGGIGAGVSSSRYSTALPSDPLTDSIAKSIIASQELLRAKLDSLRLKVQMSNSLDSGMREMEDTTNAFPPEHTRPSSHSLSELQKEFQHKREEDSKRLYAIVRENFPDLKSEDIMSIAKKFG